MRFHGKLLPEFLVLLILLSTVPKVSATQIQVLAIDDSYTSSTNPNINYGGSEFLESHNYTFAIQDVIFKQASFIWLKFNLTEHSSGLPSDAIVSSIILQLHTAAPGPIAPNRIHVFLCNDSNWQDMTITWNNSPQVTGTPIAKAYVDTGDKDYEFDVTSAVKTRGTVTLVLKTIESTSPYGQARFYSMQKSPPLGQFYYPKLIIEYSSPASFSQTIDLVLWPLISIAIIAVVFLAAYYVIRRRQQPPKTTTRKRGLIRVCCYNATD